MRSGCASGSSDFGNGFFTATSTAVILGDSYTSLPRIRAVLVRTECFLSVATNRVIRKKNDNRAYDGYQDAV